MSRKRNINLFVNFLLLAILISACSPAAVLQPTATPTPLPTPTTQPTQEVQLSRHGYHDAVYDIKSDRIIVFGGMTDTEHMLSDTWTYDITANAWAKMSPSQHPSQVEGPMAYDSASDRTILFAGTHIAEPSNGSSYAIASQTWAYDCNTDAWTDLHAIGTPSGLLGARMVYDTQADRMILFGGLKVPLPEDFVPKNLIFPTETWAFDFKNNTWTNMQPKTSPPGTNYFQMTYDSKSDRVLMFGATGSSSVVWGDDNVWAYDFEANTWTVEKSPVSPMMRDYGAMAYDPALDRTFLFGGATADYIETPFNDMWSYDYTSQTWEQVRFGSGPSARGWHTLTYSAKSDRLVLIGGGATRDSFTDEVWIFDPHAKTWTQVGPK